MAVTKTHPIKSTLKAAIDYICNPAKTDGSLLVSAYGCSAETADIEFAWTRRHAIDKGENLGRHLIQAFAPGEVTPEEAHQIGLELAKEILGGKYEFVLTTHVETVVLLSHKKADSYIHIDVEFGEGEGKIPVDSIAKRAEAYKPKEKVTYKMIKEYIEAKYGFKVHTAYIAEVKRNLGLPMYDAPNAVEELKQPRKHPTPEKVEAIKDALRYFAVI